VEIDLLLRRQIQNEPIPNYLHLPKKNNKYSLRRKALLLKKTPLTPTSIPIKLKNNKPQTAPSNDRNKVYDDIVEKLYKEQQAN